jgi:Domain of unknown function (DUF6316)
VIAVDIASKRDGVEETTMQRSTDPPTGVHFHAERIHRINGLWYYLTREGAMVDIERLGVSVVRAWEKVQRAWESRLGASI